ncbi:MAG: hypothetical protein H7Y28_15920 [Rhodoferax sp.]|nr:hypothetical protein [Rhodoferax sp.]
MLASDELDEPNVEPLAQYLIIRVTALSFILSPVKLNGFFSASKANLRNAP